MQRCLDGLKDILVSSTLVARASYCRLHHVRFRLLEGLNFRWCQWPQLPAALLDVRVTVRNDQRVKKFEQVSWWSHT